MKAVANRPREDVTYAVFTEFLVSHKTPDYRFIVYPQLSLKWKPEEDGDKRAEVPDVGVGNFTIPGADPPFKLRFGVEAKRALPVMESLPPPASLLKNPNVVTAFHSLSFQAKNQAKAAIKNRYPISGDTIQWILLIGPYWMPVVFGPFTEAELTVRAHKASPSADWAESAIEIRRINDPPLALHELFLLCEATSVHRLEEIVASTDVISQPLQTAMLVCLCLYATASYVLIEFTISRISSCRI